MVKKPAQQQPIIPTTVSKTIEGNVNSTASSLILPFLGSAKIRHWDRV
jgi:hypothetical protein